MGQLDIREVTDKTITVDAGGYFIANVRKSGNSGAVGCPKKLLGKQVMVILVDAIREKVS